MLRSSLALLLFGAAALTAVGCEEKKETPAATAPSTTTTTTTGTPAAAGPPTGAAVGTPSGAAAGTPSGAGTAPTAGAGNGAVGSIKGAVAFSGKAPEAPMINRAADPYCAKDKMKSEEVVVNGNGTLKNVLVRLTNVTGTFEAPKENATIVQEKCMYRPRVQGIVAGQTLQVRNGDKTLHNVHTYKGTSTLFNQAQIPDSPPIEKKFSDQNAMLKFKCDVHPWMLGFVSVTNHPFFAVTGDDGSFEIKNVPAGTYKIEAWHEKFGTKTADVTVAANTPADVKFSYDGTEAAK